MSRNIVLDRYIQNCTYPGTIDPNAVDAALRKYVSSLGVTRNVVQLDASWSLDRHPSLKSAIRKIADDTMRRLAARDARDAQAARDALDAQAARDARAARAARAARDALDALAARDALDALDARAALDALDAQDALDALAARDALDAQAARDARAARAARDARDALDALAARDAQAALDAQAARDARAARAARDALDALAARAALAAQAAQAALDALAAQAAQAAQDARAALDARDAQAALTRFAHWCIQSGGWWSWRWEISWIATTHIGALQLKKHIPWAEHLYDAFCSGAWFMFWTNDTLYWVAKPRVHVETIEGRHRLHRADGPAVESDIEPLYFWHGVLIPAEWIEQRDTLAASEIFKEQNAETRRAGCEIIGWDRVLDGIDAKLIDNDGDPQIGALYEGQIPGATKCTFLKVQCGTGRTFVIPTPSGLKSAIAAQAWIANKPVKQWKSPEVRG